MHSPTTYPLPSSLGPAYPSPSNDKTAQTEPKVDRRSQPHTSLEPWPSLPYLPYATSRTAAPAPARTTDTLARASCHHGLQRNCVVRWSSRRCSYSETAFYWRRHDGARDVRGKHAGEGAIREQEAAGALAHSHPMQQTSYRGRLRPLELTAPEVW